MEEVETIYVESIYAKCPYCGKDVAIERCELLDKKAHCCYCDNDFLINKNAKIEMELQAWTGQKSSISTKPNLNARAVDVVT